MIGMNEPLVNDFRGRILQAPEGDIEVSLERLKIDLRYGGPGRASRLLMAYIILLLQGGLYA
jgi:hypothetical protein